MKKPVLILSLLFLAFVLAVIICEIVPLPEERLGLLDHHHFRNDGAAEPDRDLGFHLKKSQVVYGFRHNAQGFVGPDLQTPKARETFRIFCLGGSTTLGAGVESDRFSYPELLRKMLEATAVDPDHRVEVVNAGVFGYQSLHTMILATRLLDQYRPDMFIIMDGLNDLDAAQALPLEKLKRARNALDRYESSFSNDGSVWDRMTDCFARLKLVTFLRELPGHFSEAAHATTGKGLDRVSEKYSLLDFRSNLLQAVRHAGKMGVRTMLVSDPMRILPAASADEANPSGINPDLAALYHFGRPLLHADDEAISRETGTPFLDVQPLFDGVLREGRDVVRRVWSDDLHLTRYGYFLLARDVYGELMKNPAVQKALGTSRPLSDEALDALFLDVVDWRPSDGSGWVSDGEAISPAGVEKENLRDTPNASSGWGFYSSEDKSRPAKLTLDLPEGEGTCLVFPRIQAVTDSISIEAVTPDGRRTALFSLKKAPGDEYWTPESGWYRLRIPAGLPQGSRLVMHVSGENAQLWHKGGAVLFRAAGNG